MVNKNYHKLAKTLFLFIIQCQNEITISPKIFVLLPTRTYSTFDDRSFSVAEPRVWNSLPIGVARILSEGTLFGQKIDVFFSRRPQKPSKYTSKSNPPSNNCPKNFF